MGSTTRSNTNAKIRGGATGSSVEAAVMAVERSGGVVRPALPVNRKRDEPMKTTKSYGISKKVIWDAYRRVKANRGAAGIDEESIGMFEVNLSRNLYKVWNRMCSGSYFPPPVMAVEIAKKKGGTRRLGIPTVADRVAQTAVKMSIEPALEALFHPDSYGYRPGKSALQAVAVTRQRCRQYNWVVEFDIQGAFDHLRHDLLMKAVRKHVKDSWAVLYIERWLKAPFKTQEGEILERTAGTPQGGVVSPVLMNLFMHFCFDEWMRRENTLCPFARYADDAVIHCFSRQQAQRILAAVESRLKECGLKMHPDKSAVVYCKAGHRRENYPITQFTFLGFTFKQRCGRSREGEGYTAFRPAISQEALKEIREEIRDWKIPRQTPASIGELAARYNPIIRGWCNYYGVFYKTAMCRIFEELNRRLARWARNKYRKLARHKRRSFAWLAQVARKMPTLFAHWLIFGVPAPRTMGAG